MQHSMEAKMAVWKRTWRNANGEESSHWCADYKDSTGRRVVKSFGLKRDADAFEEKRNVDRRHGIDQVDAKLTLKEAAERWMKDAEANALERSTLAGYKQHVEKHTMPRLGDDLRLSNLTESTV